MADADLAEVQEAFEGFVSRVQPLLHRSLAGWCGPDRAADATAEALAWAWEHWDQVTGLEHPVGYLYRVGQSRSRVRKPGLLPAPHELGMPDVEPDLIPALQALPPRQRTAVWLVHGCGWSQVECSVAMDVSPSAVSTHVNRGLASLRRRLEVQ